MGVHRQMDGDDGDGTVSPDHARPMRLGTCYYPEHWPEDWWPDDAKRMAEMGLSRVRIAEFAWSRIEPEPGQFEWGWLDRAVETLADAGLGIIMSTPTATPPKWLVDQMPDMIAVDEAGSPRKFGSRRHYCFSHLGYRAEAARISRAVAERYGAHPAIVAWQTDNEYGCHDSVLSYSRAAEVGFRIWLGQKYPSIEALNTAWGNVFWSQEYRHFGEIDLPNLTVTEANPAHLLDFRRYSSDQVVAFNRAQVDIIRAASPARDVVHNYMGFFTQFDHHDVSADLDVATWDSYPLGFLEQFWFSEDQKTRYACTGHPDIAAFHHDLYRGMTGGRWWVMEQQPGPVNWARYNPVPLDGMVRLWTIEAMAHGAELVSYFRWRQFPKAQEQMHAGLLRPDRVDAQGAHEARLAAADIAAIGPVGKAHQSVAILFSYDSDWVTSIQPQGEGFSALRQTFEFYSELRALHFDSIDIIAPSALCDAHDYDLIIIPCLPILPDGLVEKLKASGAKIIIGPRTGSKTRDFAIPDSLPPGDLQSLIDVKVVRSESLRPRLAPHRWIDHLETSLTDVERVDGEIVSVTGDGITYVAAWPLADGLRPIVDKLGFASHPTLPSDIRVRLAGDFHFAFNYGKSAIEWMPDCGGTLVVGETTIPAASFAVWQLNA